jgi:hypothetical protein
MTTSTIILPKTPAELRNAIQLGIESYIKSPANNDNKLNESLAKSLGFDNYNKLSPLIKEANKPKVLGYYIDREDNITTIKNTEINESIFDDELATYVVADRQDRIYWITQYHAEALAANDPRGDASSMKDDLNYLENCHDEFVLEKFGTNTFIAASKEPEAFNKACDAILELHEESLTHACKISFEGNEHTYKATSSNDALNHATEFVLDKIEGLYEYDEVLEALAINPNETEFSKYLDSTNVEANGIVLNEYTAISSVKKLNESDLNTLYCKLAGKNSFIKISKK